MLFLAWLTRDCITAPSNGPKTSADGSKWANALYQFDASEGDELAIKPGDHIKLIAAPDDEDWWTGELNGKRGIFPKSYVEFAGALPAVLKSCTH